MSPRSVPAAPELGLNLPVDLDIETWETGPADALENDVCLRAGLADPSITVTALALITTIFVTCSGLSSIGVAQQTASSPAPGKQFEVVAIKKSDPDSQDINWRGTNDRITIENYSLRHLISIAYDLKSDSQVLNGPAWIDKQHFDIAAKLEDADVAHFKSVYMDERNREIQSMLQAMLIERFHLKVTVKKRTLALYALVVKKSGAKLTALAAPANPAELKARNPSLNTRNGHLIAKAISMDSFADYLTASPDVGERIVQNKTRLSGEFDFTLDWADNLDRGFPGDAGLPGIFTALQDQLGLELKPNKGAIPVIMIDAVSEPDPD